MLINSSLSSNSFSFVQQNTTYPVRASGRIVKQSSFMTEISVTGSDHYGDWTAKGYIMARNEGEMFMWLYKVYQDEKLARQTDKWAHLLYQMTGFSYQIGIDGKWYFIGFQYSYEYSGSWKINRILGIDSQNP